MTNCEGVVLFNYKVAVNSSAKNENISRKTSSASNILMLNTLKRSGLSAPRMSHARGSVTLVAAAASGG